LPVVGVDLLPVAREPGRGKPATGYGSTGLLDSRQRVSSPQTGDGDRRRECRIQPGTVRM